MLIPTKFTQLEESTIFKMKCILENKKQHESLEDLYFRTRSNFYDISEFLYALDILFVLSIINFDEVSGVIYYA